MADCVETYLGDCCDETFESRLWVVQVNARWDVQDGNGFYKLADAGFVIAKANSLDPVAMLARTPSIVSLSWVESQGVWTEGLDSNPSAGRGALPLGGLSSPLPLIDPNGMERHPVGFPPLTFPSLYSAWAIAYSVQIRFCIWTYWQDQFNPPGGYGLQTCNQVAPSRGRVLAFEPPVPPNDPPLADPYTYRLFRRSFVDMGPPGLARAPGCCNPGP